MSFSIALLLVYSARIENQFSFEDPKGNLKVIAQSGMGEQKSDGTNHLLLKGSVSIRSKSQGLSLDANQVEGEAVRTAKGDSELSYGIATGKVHLVKSATVASGGKTGGPATDITSSRADLRAHPEGDVVKLAGPVKISSTDTVKHRSMVATGSSGVATLTPEGSPGPLNGLRAATLEGPVKIVMKLAPRKKGESPTEIVATGGRLEISTAGNQPVVTLTGHVVIKGQGIGTFSGFNVGTLKLNEAGEVVGYGGKS